MTPDLDENCRSIYAEMKSFYDENAEACGNLGFKILYGPPLFRPPILFIGYQPGGSAESYMRELHSGAHQNWPPICEYATATWKLAKKLQEMFGKGLLKQCVALNAILIRSPSVKVYRTSVSKDMREKIRGLCVRHVYKMVELMKPQRIVLIGFDTLDFFGGGAPVIKNEKGRPLIRVGQIGDWEAIATLHLSGAQIVKADIVLIQDYILAESSTH